MSAKARCPDFIYCNDCANRGKSQWKLVDANSDEAQWYNTKKQKNCKPCKKSHDDDKGNHDNKCHDNNNYENIHYEKSPERYNCNDWSKKCCKGDGGINVCTLISVKNPTSELIIPELTAGIAAISPLQVIGEAVDLTGWTDIVPDALNLFNNATGTYTAPEDGDYQVSLVVNYETSVPLNASPTLNDVPVVQIYNVDAPADRILASQFPTINILIVIPPISSGELPIEIVQVTIIAKAQVIINAVIPLVAGERIRARAITNGLIYTPIAPISISPLQLIPPLPPRIDFSPEGVDTTLTIYKLRNSPIITINCNN
jgi:hypothetical protein